MSLTRSYDTWYWRPESFGFIMYIARETFCWARSWEKGKGGGERGAQPTRQQRRDEEEGHGKRYRERYDQGRPPRLLGADDVEDEISLGRLQEERGDRTSREGDEK